MKHIFKLVSGLLTAVILFCGIFMGYIFVKGNDIVREIEAANSFNYEISYHFSGDSDLFGTSRYDAENVPMIVQSFLAYFDKLEQGGNVSGEMKDAVYHGNLYAEGDEASSFEFYYGDDVIFGMKQTMDYIVSAIESETEIPISVLLDKIPEGYVTFEQLQRLFGEVGNDNISFSDWIGEGKEIISAIKLVLPMKVEDNYFQESLEDVHMVYGNVITGVDSIMDAEVIMGLANEADSKYIYLKIKDVFGNGKTDLEVLVRIDMVANDPIIIPETISDDMIEALASVIALFNGFGQ